MRTAVVLLALVVALALQTILAGLLIGGRIAVNLVLVAVVYVALAFGPVTGLLAGVVGGLTQDALAGGIVGIGGLAKTLIGFAVGVLGAQFIVSQMLPRFVMFVAATFLHEVMFQGLHALIESRPLALHYSAGADSGGRQRRWSACSRSGSSRTVRGSSIAGAPRQRAAFSKRRF